MRTELTWRRVSTQLQHRVPPFPQLSRFILERPVNIRIEIVWMGFVFDMVVVVDSAWS